jgi:hypothetical protein
MWVWMILFLEAPISERPFRFIQQHTSSVLILLLFPFIHTRMLTHKAVSRRLV